MPSIRPTTRTPGSLKLLYTHRGHLHRSSVNLLANIDILDITARRADAVVLAQQLQSITPNSLVIYGWATYTRPGTNAPATLIYQEQFPSSLAGTMAGAAGARDFVSLTAKYTGRGTPGGAGYAVGETYFLYHAGVTLYPTPEQKSFGVGLTPQHQQFANVLQNSTHFWADFYGQKASVRGTIPIQFHASIQRALGS